jgi:hypothetical protein
MKKVDNKENLASVCRHFDKQNLGLATYLGRKWAMED